MDTYYRLHWAGSPEFSAENAWSAPWGNGSNVIRSEDGSQYRCFACDGVGCESQYGEPTCDDGWVDCRPGYSCIDSTEGLVAYFREWGEPSDSDGEVIVFTGHLVEYGDTDEPIVEPIEVLERLTWSQLKERVRVSL